MFSLMFASGSRRAGSGRRERRLAMADLWGVKQGTPAVADAQGGA